MPAPRPSERVWLLPVLLAIVLLVAACAGGGASQSGPQSVRLTAREMSFSPAEVTLKAGVPVRLTLANEGTVEHDVTIPGISAGPLPTAPAGGDHGHATELPPDTVHLVAAPGQQASIEFTPKAGTFELYCSVAGHKEAGMRGTVRVQ